MNLTSLNVIYSLPLQFRCINFSGFFSLKLLAPLFWVKVEYTLFPLNLILKVEILQVELFLRL